MEKFKMPPNINWKEIVKVDLDDLPLREELADNLSIASVKAEVNELKDKMWQSIQNYLVTDGESTRGRPDSEEVEQAGEGQAKFENQLNTKVIKLENELEMVQHDDGILSLYRTKFTILKTSQNKKIDKECGKVLDKES